MKLSIVSVGEGKCALTGKEGDGLKVAFEGEQPLQFCWKAFRQLVSMKVGQHSKPEPQAPATNGAALAAR